MLARMAGAVMLASSLNACGDADPSGPGEVVCGAVPDDLAVPIQTTEAMPMHWPVADGCIRVTYDPAVATHRPDFTAALNAWSGLACSTMCFTEPAALEDVPELDYDFPTLHIGPAETVTPETPDTTQAIHFHRTATGQIVLGYIVLATPGDALAPADWSHHVGFALGLGPAERGVDSRLSAEYDRAGPVTPTALDEESFCALYGDPPLCTP